MEVGHRMTGPIRTAEAIQSIEDEVKGVPGQFHTQANSYGRGRERGQTNTHDHSRKNGMPPSQCSMGNAPDRTPPSDAQSQSGQGRQQCTTDGRAIKIGIPALQDREGGAPALTSSLAVSYTSGREHPQATTIQIIHEGGMQVSPDRAGCVPGQTPPLVYSSGSRREHPRNTTPDRIREVGLHLLGDDGAPDRQLYWDAGSMSGRERDEFNTSRRDHKSEIQTFQGRARVAPHPARPRRRTIMTALLVLVVFAAIAAWAIAHGGNQ